MEISDIWKKHEIPISRPSSQPLCRRALFFYPTFIFSAALLPTYIAMECVSHLARCVRI